MLLFLLTGGFVKGRVFPAPCSLLSLLLNQQLVPPVHKNLHSVVVADARAVLGREGLCCCHRELSCLGGEKGSE